MREVFCLYIVGDDVGAQIAVVLEQAVAVFDDFVVIFGDFGEQLRRGAVLIAQVAQLVLR